MTGTADALAYYANGWYAGGESGTLKWESPPTRCVVDLPGRTWQRYLERARRAASAFELRWDTAFAEVVEGCTAGRQRTWIDPPMKDLYRRLHLAGAAHSAEVWLDGTLVAGVVGVALGRWVSMETTFHTVSSSGHAAIAAMAELAARRDCVLLDVQQSHPFTRRLGGVEIPRDEYLELLHAALTP
ncbi:leucyl/phenylalanyl-tRNA--protein transferase [Actinoplanes sp. NPDC049596]|uniref:leucyl/phenylalanyl-tRNA--protein transferase n=1 Tax=unclassified Actinoplanes TaxID=2626549 RepID=UPI00341B0FEA